MVINLFEQRYKEQGKTTRASPTKPTRDYLQARIEFANQIAQQEVCLGTPASTQTRPSQSELKLINILT